MRNLVVLCLSFFLICPASHAQADEVTVTVFAAASLRGALDEVAQHYPGDIRLSYGGSGTIARQIAAGAPADIVILADQTWMNWLATQGVKINLPQRDLLTNTLALIAPIDSAKTSNCMDDLSLLLPPRERLAMGQRDAVPAGRYAQDWLRHIGQWENLAPRLAETDNVRAALALVARAQVPLGVVYATDAQAEPRVKVLCIVPEETHRPILYPAAQLTPQGAAFWAHLVAAPAAEIFKDHGFGLPAPS